MRAERFIETIREELTSNLPRLNIVREWLQTAKTANTHHDLNTPTTDAAGIANELGARRLAGLADLPSPPPGMIDIVDGSGPTTGGANG